MPTSATPVQLVNPDTGIPYAALPGTPAATDSSNNRQVVGNTASRSTDSGAPVKVGFAVSATPPADATSGQRIDAWGTTKGALVVAAGSLSFNFGDNLGLGNGAFTGIMDTGNNGKALVTAGLYFDGTNYSRARGDTNGAFSVSKGGSSIATGQVAVTTTATQIVPARAGRQKITLSPTSSTVYYVGAAGVTTTTGLYVPAGGTITLDTAAAVFAVGAAALTVSYIEFF